MVTVRRQSGLKTSIQIELIKYFCAGVTARSAAELSGVNRNTAILFFHKLRETIHEEIISGEATQMSGEIELDESYFGGRRKGKRGRGAGGKVPVFGLLKRNGYVHAMIIPNAASATLVPIIREKIKPHSIVYTDSFRAYDVLDVQSSITIVSTTPSCLLTSTTTSTELRTFGTSQNVTFVAIMAFQKSTFIYSSKNANGASIIAQ